MADLMKQFTQTGGEKTVFKIGNPSITQTIGDDVNIPDGFTDNPAGTARGRRRRHSKHHKGNSWLAHVKATMKLHPGKSFKQILKIAKKTYKKSQSRSQSQSGGKRRKRQSQKNQKNYQSGGSGGKMAGLGESAAPYV